MKKKTIGVVLQDPKTNEKTLSGVLKRFRKFLKMTKNAKIRKFVCIVHDKRCVKESSGDLKVMCVKNYKEVVKKCSYIVFIWDEVDSDIRDIVKMTKKAEKHVYHYFTSTKKRKGGL